MDEKVAYLLNKMCDKEEDEAYEYADKLAKTGTDEVLQELIKILKGNDPENANLAARALSKMDNNKEALDPLLEIIHDKANRNTNGALVQALEGFDLSSKIVDVCRIYLFGNFKSSALAKEYLDYVEFDISPRVIKKIEKHLSHFENNISNEDGDYQEKKVEVENILLEIRKIIRTE